MTADLSITHEFEQSVARGITLVDFYAPWCRPCRDQRPVLKELEDRFSGRVRIEIIEIDAHREIALNLGIQSIPTIIIFKDGQEMRRFIGLQSGDTLSRALQSLAD